MWTEVKTYFLYSTVFNEEIWKLKTRKRQTQILAISTYSTLFILTFKVIGKQIEVKVNNHVGWFRWTSEAWAKGSFRWIWQGNYYIFDLENIIFYQNIKIHVSFCNFNRTRRYQNNALIFLNWFHFRVHRMGAELLPQKNFYLCYDPSDKILRKMRSLD